MSKQIDVFYDEKGKEVNITCYHGRIEGKIVNSVVDKNKTDELTNWKKEIANKIKEAGIIGNTNKFYGLKLKLYFSTQNHNNVRDMDLDNYIKPIIDGIGSGMFKSLNNIKEADEIHLTNSQKKERFNPPDHLFYFISAIKIILPNNNNQQEGIEYCIYEFDNLRDLYFFADDYFS